MDTKCQGKNYQHVKIGEVISIKLQHNITERPLLDNRRRQFFGSTNKTMKNLLNNGDTTYGDTLDKFVTSFYLLTKL